MTALGGLANAALRRVRKQRRQRLGLSANDGQRKKTSAYTSYFLCPPDAGKRLHGVERHADIDVLARRSGAR